MWFSCIIKWSYRMTSMFWWDGSHAPNDARKVMSRWAVPLLDGVFPLLVGVCAGDGSSGQGRG